ncbi:MAG: B12-binding domain-containing radical SAM protein [Nitrospinae bacterium]|nr:B12-binding domain-containing radical SAM protein [Nitrospinota bacterium]
MKRILLVFPGARESVWSMRLALKIMRKRAFIPPLGLATVAGLTPAGYEVRIIDETVEPVDLDWPCDLVGIAGYTFNSPRMLELADEFRKRGVMTAGGGPFCKTHADVCKKHFDVVFSGEVENTWPKFLAEWENGAHAAFYEETGAVDMTASPPPRWDLLDMGAYSSGIVQTTRGCVYDCEFCDVVALTGRRVRSKSLEAVTEEIRALIRLGVSAIWVADDNFTANTAYAKEVLAKIISINRETGKRARFITQITAEKAFDEELIALLKEAGFFAVLIGIESPNRESLAETGKIQNLKTDLAEAVRKVQSSGIYVVGGMVVGFDADGRDVFDRHERFISESGLLLPVVSMLKASRGTRLWKRLSESGRLTEEDDGDFYSGSNFVPLGLTKAELADGYDNLTRILFGYDNSIGRFSQFIARVEDAPRPAPVSIQDVLAGLRASLHFLLGPSERRRFFIRGIRTGLKRGLWGATAFVELAVWLESHRDFHLKDGGARG